MMSLRALTASIVLAAAAGVCVVPAAQAAPVQLTGTQLAAALLPGSTFFPDGEARLDKAATTNSGRRLEHARTRHNLAAIGCTALFIDIGYRGFGESAMAASAYIVNGTYAAFWQSVYQFTSSASARSFFTATRAAWLRCPSFNDSGSYAVRVKPVARSSYLLIMVKHIRKATSDLAVLATWTGTDVYMIEAVNILPWSYSELLPDLMRELIARVRAASGVMVR